MQVVILGMHRSGTSIVSKIVSNLGIDMSESNDVAVSNIEGHFEDHKILAINEGLLSRLNSTWFNPPCESDIFLERDYILNKYKSYVQIRNEEALHWGVKEPRLTLFSDIMHDALSEPKYIYCIRSENDVAESVYVRDGIAREDAINLKKNYDLSAEKTLKGKEYLTVEYSELINNPAAVLDNIINYLNVDIDIDIDAISHIKTRKELSSRKLELFTSQLGVHIKTSFLEPKKIFRKETIFLVKQYIRRAIELIFK